MKDFIHRKTTTHDEHLYPYPLYGTSDLFQDIKEAARLKSITIFLDIKSDIKISGLWQYYVIRYGHSGDQRSALSASKHYHEQVESSLSLGTTEWCNNASDHFSCVLRFFVALFYDLPPNLKIVLWTIHFCGYVCGQLRGKVGITCFFLWINWGKLLLCHVDEQLQARANGKVIHISTLAGALHICV